MEKVQVKELWNRALVDVLGTSFDDDIVDVLALQTIDSIRRISIYETYANKAQHAEDLDLLYFHTSTPFILSQRSSFSLDAKIWYVYLATYFGKSNKSKWTLFNNASFRPDKSLITLDYILENREAYYNYLRGFDFFAESDYSNHRKYIKKSIDGERGVLASFDYFLDNISDFSSSDPVEFDVIYKKALSIPSFGRMAAFDFTSSLCKCDLNVNDPISMYHKTSTGPLRALRDILELSGVDNPSKADQIRLGDDLLAWFIENSDIKIVAQVIEDAICNWQKSPIHYERYFG